LPYPASLVSSSTAGPVLTGQSIPMQVKMLMLQ
jgi:hypothetical protein